VSFLPVVAIYLISQRTEQAFWIDRYFIFTAVPYLLLVAVAVNRLEPKRLRYAWIGLILFWGFYAGVHDLRTNRMAWEGAQMGSRIAWDSMARQLIAAEPESSERVDIYTLTVISNGLRTGDWATSTSIGYFLDSYGDNRFRFVYARDIRAVLGQPTQDDHFWIAYFELTESHGPSPREILQEGGYRVGDAIEFQQLSNTVILLPVWRE
jgi:hypothetical protein